LRHNAPEYHTRIDMIFWRIPINCQSIGNAWTITVSNRILSPSCVREAMRVIAASNYSTLCFVDFRL